MFITPAYRADRCGRHQRHPDVDAALHSDLHHHVFPDPAPPAAQGEGASGDDRKPASRRHRGHAVGRPHRPRITKVIGRFAELELELAEGVRIRACHARDRSPRSCGPRASPPTSPDANRPRHAAGNTRNCADRCCASRRLKTIGVILLTLVPVFLYAMPSLLSPETPRSVDAVQYPGWTSSRSAIVPHPGHRPSASTCRAASHLLLAGRHGDGGAPLHGGTRCATTCAGSCANSASAALRTASASRRTRSWSVLRSGCGQSGRISP
jgi:hypothetical protein